MSAGTHDLYGIYGGLNRLLSERFVASNCAQLACFYLTYLTLLTGLIEINHVTEETNLPFDFFYYLSYIAREWGS